MQHTQYENYHVVLYKFFYKIIRVRHTGNTYRILIRWFDVLENQFCTLHKIIACMQKYQI